MSNLVKAHYSLKTGKRVTDNFAQRNPNYVRSFTFLEGSVPPEFLKRGETIPSTLTNAESAEAARKATAEAEEVARVNAKAVKDAKLRVRRARYAAKKAGTTFAAAVVAEKTAAKKSTKSKPGKKIAKKVAAKKTRVVTRDLTDGEFAKKTAVGPKITSDVIPTAGNAPKKLKKNHKCKPVVKEVAAKKAVKKVLPASQSGLVN